MCHCEKLDSVGMVAEEEEPCHESETAPNLEIQSEDDTAEKIPEKNIEDITKSHSDSGSGIKPLNHDDIHEEKHISIPTEENAKSSACVEPEEEYKVFGSRNTD